MSKPQRIKKGRLKAKKIVDIENLQRDEGRYKYRRNTGFVHITDEERIHQLEKNRKRDTYSKNLRNPRQYGGGQKSIQEKRKEQDINEQIKEQKNE